MSKAKNQIIEEIIDKITLNDKINYIIKYRDENAPKLVEEEFLSTIEKKYCENYLNRKRRKNDNITAKIKPSKFTNKIKKDKDDNDDDNDDNDDDNDDDDDEDDNDDHDDDNDDDNDDHDDDNNLSNSSYYSISNKEETKKNNNKNKIKKEENKNKNKEIFKERNKINKSENKNKIKTPFEREGILLEDKPVQIINVGYKNKNDKTLYSLVKWEQKDSIRILDSIIENKKIRTVCPQLLIDFYESKIILLEDK